MTHISMNTPVLLHYGLFECLHIQCGSLHQQQLHHVQPLQLNSLIQRSLLQQ